MSCEGAKKPHAAEEALAAAGAEADSADLRLLLWQATGERAHLEAAKRLLDEALANVPDEDRERMRRNLRVNREIVAAAKEEIP